jgi:putative phosphoesterase
MRIALISDLHANLVALDAVLLDAERAGVDQLVCLGDVATLGPCPREILARLRALGCVCILGNHDEFLLEPALVRKYSEHQVVVDSVDWCRDRLTAEDVAFVRGFRRTYEVALEGGGTLLLFHGSVRSNVEDLLATTSPERLDQALDGRSATVLAGGHTHLQMLRQHRGMLLVNPGSVGLPFREYAQGGPPVLLPDAEYAIVASSPAGVTVELRRVRVAGERLREAVASSDVPLAEMLRAQYRMMH